MNLFSHFLVPLVENINDTSDITVNQNIIALAYDLFETLQFIYPVCTIVKEYKRICILT